MICIDQTALLWSTKHFRCFYIRTSFESSNFSTCEVWLDALVVGTWEQLNTSSFIFPQLRSQLWWVLGFSLSLPVYLHWELVQFLEEWCWNKFNRYANKSSSKIQLVNTISQWFSLMMKSQWITQPVSPSTPFSWFVTPPISHPWLNVCRGGNRQCSMFPWEG